MNLVETLKNEIDRSTINQVGEKVGITSEQVDRALSAGIPATLSAMLKNNSLLTGSGFLSKMLSGGASSNLGNIVNGTTAPQTGDDDVAQEVYGNNFSAVKQSIAEQAGVDAGKSGTLLSAIIPLVTGAISKTMSKNNWSVGDFISKIWDSKDSIVAALPAGLSSSFGLGLMDSNMPSTPKVEIPKVEVPKVEVPKVNINRTDTDAHIRPAIDRPTYVPKQEEKSSSFLKWLIPLLLIIGILWYLFGRNTDKKVEAVVDTTTEYVDTAVAAVKGTLNDAGDYIADLGTAVARKLPNGGEISVGTNSVESRLIDFIEDKNKAVDKVTWFTFDRLFFETGKSTLKAESKAQLNNIAAILSAYPNVTLKLGGYTDNTGDSEVNKRISKERAEAAMQALVDLGVDPSRLDAEGYGSEHPVASNDTAEGKAQNRRIDVRVSSK